MFSISGVYKGKKSIITWDGGVIRGDNENLIKSLLVRNVNSKEEGPVPGPYTSSNHLNNPLSAMTMILSELDSWDVASGDLPVVPREIEKEMEAKEKGHSPIVY